MTIPLARLLLVISAAMVSCGCNNTSEVPGGVVGLLVDDHLKCLDVRTGIIRSIRPVVDGILKRSSRSGGLRRVRYVASPNGRYVACLSGENTIDIVDLAAGKALQSFALPEDCIEAGAISWRPDCSGFVCHVRTSTWDATQPTTSGTGYILAVSLNEPGLRELSGIGRISELWATTCLADTAWYSNNCFLYGDGKDIKAYDLPTRQVKCLFEGYSPIAAAPDGCIYQTQVNSRGLFECRRIDGSNEKPLTDYQGTGVLNRPVVSPDGRFLVFLNESWGSTLFGLAGGMDYTLTTYDRHQGRFAEIRSLEGSFGAPEATIMATAVWVIPLDVVGWKRMLGMRQDGDVP